MKKPIFTTALLVISLLTIGCNQAQTANTDSNNQVQTDNSEVASENKEPIDNPSSNSNNQDSTITEKPPVDTGSTTAKIPVNNTSKTPKAGEGQPKVGTIKDIVQGDLKCYVTLTDEQGKEQNLSASFEICAQDKQFLNQKVNLSYDILSFNDCESNEPCGKTKKESAIVKMDVIGSSKNSQKSSGDTVNLSNGEWTIKLSNYDSWNGTNGTGNVNYNGCDSKNNCIKLTGGKVFCRDGKCVTGWQNGEYGYAIESAITEDNNNQPSTLIVRQGDKVILRAEGLKRV
ncbi:MAG: hypothetical protein VKN72_08065 [Nostocales cyanobacterium 94392]|nr:hypothetical protein [Nostocales cyanobacterium 94392]